MKTIFTLLAGLVLSIAVFADPGYHDGKTKSMLTVKSASREEISVIIDGKRFDPRHNYLAIRNIGSGYHSVKIYRQKSAGFFDKFRNRYEMVFNKSIIIRKNTNLVLTIDRLGRTHIDQQRIKGKGRDFDWYQNKNNGRDFDNDDFKKDKDYDRNNDFDNDRKSGDDEFEFDFDNDGQIEDYDNGYDDRNNKSMSDREFSNVVQSIQKEWFEGNKVKSASQIISTNYLTSVQVKQMLRLFSFEKNRLDLAKQAYGKTVDPGNYLMELNDVFNFQSNKDEMVRYVRSYRN